MQRDDFHDMVAKSVSEKLSQHSWFRGVCMDTVDANYPNLEKAVESAIDDTIMWDCPGGLFGYSGSK